MEAVLTCGHCGEPGRLTLAREKDSLEWKGETLMHTECGAMGEPMDVFMIPLWPLPRVFWKRTWLWQWRFYRVWYQHSLYYLERHD
jgi:hypothetical protein